jgi:FtsP/CotA-like multicopper oxidase with cupredoxin domain
MHPLALLLAFAAPSADSLGPAVPARIAFHDNRVAAGTLRNGELTLRLEVTEGRWFPDGEQARSEVIHAFAEAGKAPTVPGPMIRVPEGTRLRITIRNTLDSTLVLHGMHARPGVPGDTVQVAPGSQREVRFTAGAAGTYYYWASTTGGSMRDLRGLDSQLSGAFIVDPPGARADDRVFVIGMWFKPLADSTGPRSRQYADLMVINGRMWPHTERLRFAEGDSVRWRWINASESSHPMHLHGFYFRVDAQGDWARDTAYAPDQRRLVVTQLMLPGATMDVSWRAEREGNWVFHCHFSFHVSHWLMMGSPDSVSSTAHDSTHRHHRMSGLVLGLHVDPKRGPERARASRPARRLRLVLQEVPGRFDTVPGYGFVLRDPSGQQPDSVPDDSVPRSGPVLELVRGEPVAITVINRMRQMTGVHWHGIELESFPDGVPEWSGTPGRLMPPIMPGDSFIAEFVPPRSGTFMYHAHSNEDAQISGGLYGALVVRDSGTVRNPDTDRIVLLGASGPFPNGGTLNGERDPAPIEMKAGRTYRLRIIHIQPDWRAHFTLLDHRGLLEWRPVAKDGADLPESQRKPIPARLLAGPGETADFEFTPKAAGEVRLEITSHGTGWHLLQEIRVRE